jgi:hypothetical protein
VGVVTADPPFPLTPSTSAADKLVLVVAAWREVLVEVELDDDDDDDDDDLKGDLRLRLLLAVLPPLLVSTRAKAVLGRRALTLIAHDEESE